MAIKSNEYSNLRLSNDDRSVSDRHTSIIPVREAYGRLAGGTIGGMAAGSLYMNRRLLTSKMVGAYNKNSTVNKAVKKPVEIANKAYRKFLDLRPKVVKKTSNFLGEVVGKRVNKNAGNFIKKHAPTIIAKTRKYRLAGAAIGAGIIAGKTIGGAASGIAARKKFQKRYGGNTGSTSRAIRSFVTSRIVGRKHFDVNATYGTRIANKARLNKVKDYDADRLIRNVNNAQTSPQK